MPNIARAFSPSSALNNRQHALLGAAIANADEAVVVRLIPKLADAGMINVPHAGGTTFLHLAVCRRQVNIVRALLRAGADHSAADSDGRTPLYYLPFSHLVSRAARRIEMDNEAVRGAFGLDDDMPQIARLLLRAGANPLTPPASGDCFVSVAVRLGMERLCSMLLEERWIEPDAVLPGGFTMLMIAAQMGHAQIAWALMRHGASVSLRHPDSGYAAPDFALQSDNRALADMLLHFSPAQARES